MNAQIQNLRATMNASRIEYNNARAALAVANKTGLNKGPIMSALNRARHTCLSSAIRLHQALLA